MTKSSKEVFGIGGSEIQFPVVTFDEKRAHVGQENKVIQAYPLHQNRLRIVDSAE